MGVAHLGKAFQIGERHDEADGAAFGVLQDAAQVRCDSDRRRAKSVKRSQTPGSHLRCVRTGDLRSERKLNFSADSNELYEQNPCLKRLSQSAPAYERGTIGSMCYSLGQPGWGGEGEGAAPTCGGHSPY